jgi:hypothetical protein
MRLRGSENGPGIPEGYIRVKDRPAREQEHDATTRAGDNGAPFAPDEDDLPF